MSRVGFAVVLAALLAALFVGPLGAAEPQEFEFHVAWGQEGYSGSYVTYWYAQADPAMQVRNFVYTHSAISGMSGYVTLPPEGVSKLYMGTPNHIYQVRGFYLAPDFAPAIAGTFWQSANCLPGPGVGVRKSASGWSVYVSNTTSGTLYVSQYQGGGCWHEVPPGGVMDKEVMSRGHMIIQTQPDAADQYLCADVRWSYYFGAPYGEPEDPAFWVVGYAYWDANGDGYRQGDESGPHGVTVYLEDQEGNVVTETQTTPPNGWYGLKMLDVNPGIYKVRIESPYPLTTPEEARVELLDWAPSLVNFGLVPTADAPPPVDPEVVEIPTGIRPPRPEPDWPGPDKNR